MADFAGAGAVDGCEGEEACAVFFEAGCRDEEVVSRGSEALDLVDQEFVGCRVASLCHLSVGSDASYFRTWTQSGA